MQMLLGRYEAGAQLLENIELLKDWRLGAALP